MEVLKQSTAASLIVGPILDSTGVEYASAVIGDISLSKNGATLTALASAATLTYIANGLYTLALTTGNTDTLGRAEIFCTKSTYQMPPVRLSVLAAATFDALITNASGAAGGLLIAGSNAATTFAGLTTGALACTTITSSGAVAFQSTFAVTTSTALGALSCTTLTASGAVAFQSTFIVTGAVTFSSTFATTGTTTFNAFVVTNNCTVSGNLLVSGTTTHTGAVSFGSTFGVTGTTTLAAVTTTGTVTLNALTVTNATTLSGAVSLGSTLGVTGTTTLAAVTTTGTVTFNAFTVSGTTTLTLAANTITATSIAADAITAAKIADGAIDRATFAADTGLQTIRSNTATGGASASITLDAAASATNSFYSNCLIYLTGGTGAGQARKIRSYVGSSKVATVAPAWTTTPISADTTFAILPAESVWDEITGDHLATGSAGTSLNAAGSAGDPWTTVLPGAYGPTTAGGILGINLDAAMTSRLAPTVAGRTLDVSVGGEAGLDWANIGTPGATVGLTATTLSAVTTVATTAAVTTVNGLAANTITAAALATDAGAEIAAATWDLATVGHTTSGTFGAAMNAAGAAGDPWSTSLPGAYGSGTAGYIVGTNINALITSRMATYTQPTGFLAATFPSGTVANTTNITAGTITTVTTLTNLPAITAGWLTATGIAADAITAAKIADGAIDSATFAAGTTIPRCTLVDTCTVNTDMRGTDSAALAATALSTVNWTTARAGYLDNLNAALTEGYAADGAPATLSQLLYMVYSCVQEFSIAGTSISLKKLDGTTVWGTVTLDSSTAPTSRTRSS